MKTDQRAFTLIELSIVMVIVGLLIAGILSGKSLIRAAELRSVMTESNNYISAINTFRTQYRYLPGDMPTATKYWGSAGGDGANAACFAASPDMTSTCNGNGDGLVNGLGVTPLDERFRVWQQLSNAGYIDKRYTGVKGAGGTDDFVLNENIPEARVKLTGFSFYYANITGNGTTLYNVVGNTLTYGSGMGTDNGPPTNATLRPIDAANMDTKMDDGMPGSGRWIANGTGGGNFGAATACSNVAGTGYTVANEVASCSFFIKSGF